MDVSEPLREQVWDKGRVVQGHDPTHWRKDECGAWMRRAHFASEDSEFAWTIHNVSPGGPDTLENLRPFHRDNGYDVANGRAVCRVAADTAGTANQRID